MEVARRDARGAAGSPPASNLQSSLHLRLSVLSNHLAPASSPGDPEGASVLARNLTRGVPAYAPPPAPDTCSPGTLHARLSFSRPAWQQPPRLTVSPERYSAGLHSSHSDSSLLFPGECGRSSKGAAQACGGASTGKKGSDSCCMMCSGTGKAPSGCACSCALGYTEGKLLPPPLPHRRDSRSLFAKQADNSTTNSTAALSAETKGCCSKCGSTNPAACGCNCGPADAIVSTGCTARTPRVTHVGTRSNAVLFGRVAAARETEHHPGSFLTPEALTGGTPPGAGGAAATAGVPGARPDIRRDHRVLFARAAREPECHHRSFLEGGSLVGVGNHTGGVPRGDSRQLFGRPCSEATGVMRTAAEDRAATAGAVLLQQAKEGGTLYSDASVAAHNDKNSGMYGDRPSTAVQGAGAPAVPETAWQGARRDSRALFACVPPPHSPSEAPAVPLPAGGDRASAGPPQAPSSARLSSLISSWSSSAPAGGAPHTGVPEGAQGPAAGVPDSERHVTMVVPLPSGTSARGLQVEIVAGRLLRVAVAGPGCTRVLFEGPLPRGVASARSSQALLRDSALYLSFPKA